MYKSIRRHRFPQHAGGIQRVVVTRLAGDDDHRNMTRMRMRRNFLPHRDAAQKWKAEIENDRYGRVAVERAKRIEAVRGFENLVAGERQRRTVHPSKVDVVFDDEDGLHD